MPIGEPPPLHPDAFTGTPPIETIRTPKIASDQMTRFPTYHLEPFQLQRAQALERAVAMLPDGIIEDQLKAAQYIETGHIPDA